MDLLFQYLLMTICSFTVRAFDPCVVGNHHEFPTFNFGARKDNCSQELYAPCDYYLEEQWYTSSIGSLSNACPSVGSCGVAFPAWIDGSFPSVSEGIVNLTVCIKKGNLCCHQSDLRAQIKNCDGFYVYNLPALNECPSAYCFGSDLPCEATTARPSSPTQSTPRSDATTLSNVRTTTLKDNYPDMFPDNNGSWTLVVGICVGAGVVLIAVGAAVGVHLVFKYYSGSRSRKTSPLEVKRTPNGQLPRDHIYATREAPPPYTTALAKQ